jgi:rsbT co-antagonist protein RsbR
MTEHLSDAAAQAQVHDLAELRRQYEIDDGDLDLIRAFGSIVVPKLDQFIRRFYEWMETLPEYEEFFPDGSVAGHVTKMQVNYWERFFSASLDEAYVEERVRVGEVHARIGLPMPLYLRSMDKAFRILTQDLYDDSLESDTYTAALHAIVKLAHLDTTFVLDVNLRLVNETAMAQSRTLMEMSTPVTQIWGGVLFLPIVGIIDSKRAQDIMNSTLAKIAQTQARAFIMDISGVAVVDTAVANYLIKVTKATRLMGCETTISGVSPSIAQTIVDLGIDVGKVKTTATMQDALADTFAGLGVSLNRSS